MTTHILVRTGAVVAVAWAVALASEHPTSRGASDPAQSKDGAGTDDRTEPARLRMVERHLVERGIKNPRVLDAFRTVPRHLFVPPESRRLAYDDESIPIGEAQTITPP